MTEDEQAKEDGERIARMVARQDAERARTTRLYERLARDAAAELVTMAEEMER